MAGIGAASKSILKKALVLDHKRGRTLGNLYTGKKLNGYVLGGAMVGAGLVAAGGPSGLFGEQKYQPKNLSQVKGPMGMSSVMKKPVAPAQGVTMSPATMADGVGPATHERGSNAPDLNATGNIVFGMHNTRHG